MEPSPCQALCAFGCEVSEQLGALLALAAWALMTTLLALWERYRLGRERKGKLEAQAAAAEAERLALEASAKATEAAATADYWREQSMRAPAMPREAIAFELGYAGLPSMRPEATAAAEEAARAGTRWVSLSERPPEPSEPPTEPSEPPEQFADEPTDPGKRKPS